MHLVTPRKQKRASVSVSYLIPELMRVLQKASEGSNQAKLFSFSFFVFFYTIMKIAVHHLFRLIDVLKISVEIAC
jgi:hypothetical protein